MYATKYIAINLVKILLSKGSFLSVLKKEIGVYFVGKVMSYASPILLLPILTFVLSTEDYGVVGTYSSVYLVLNTFISLSGTGAVVRAYMDKDDPGFDFSTYLFNAMLVNAVLFLLALAPLYFFSAFGYINLPSVAIMLLPLVVILAAYRAYKHKLWNIQKRAVNYSVFDVSFTFTALILSVIFVYSVLPDWRGRIYAIVVAEAIFCVVSLYYLFKEDGVIFKINTKYMKSVFMYGLPLVPHSMGLTLLASSDKLLLNSLADLSSVGIYAVAASIASLVLVVSIPIDQALKPYVFKILKQGEEIGYKQYIVGFWGYFLISTFAALMIYLISPYVIPLFIGEPFHSAGEYVGILLFGQVAHAMYRYVIKLVFFSRKTHLVSISTIISGVVGFACQVLLIEQYGITGAAIGTSIAYVLSFLISWYFSNRVYPMSWRKSPQYIMNAKALF